MAEKRARRRRVSGEGTVYQRKDGRWEAAVWVVTPDGTRRRKRVYGGTRDEAHGKYVDLLSKRRAGTPVPTRNPTVAEYLTYWLEHVAAVDRRPKTYVGYEGVVRLYLVPGLGRRRLDQLSAQHVRVYLNQIRERCICCAQGLDRERRQCCSADRCCGKRPSPRTVQFVHAVLRNALQNAVREELVPRNVAKLVPVPVPQYETSRGLSVADARRLLEAVRDDRLYALYLLALMLGLRRAELLGLRWVDVDLTAATLEVRQTLQRVRGELRFLPPKTARSRRTIPLPGTCVDALREHWQRQGGEKQTAERWTDLGLVFPSRVGTPIQPDNLYRHFQRVRESTGLAGVRFHDLRHTCVTLLLDVGVPPHVVRAIAGHSDIKVTMDIYAHASLDEQRRALRRLGDRFGDA